MKQKPLKMLGIWVRAMRLRTLPLALSSIGKGSFLAAEAGDFHLLIFGLCVFTTIFLQVLSNLANDYGDAIHGADSEQRTGPTRAVQSGAISPQAMLRAVILFSVLALLSGLALLYVSINTWQQFFFFLGLGLISILAAITYTAGRAPYGYAGLGDVSVFIFFGLIGVSGPYYLFTKEWHLHIFWPAASCGLLATAVLNVNNIRDISADRAAGKKSIPVRIGREKARIYHWSLLTSSLLCALIYVLNDFQGFIQLLFLGAAPLLWLNARAVSKIEEPSALDPYLRQLALSSVLMVVLFGLGQLMV